MQAVTAKGSIHASNSPIDISTAIENIEETKPISITLESVGTNGRSNVAVPISATRTFNFEGFKYCDVGTTTKGGGVTSLKTIITCTRSDETTFTVEQGTTIDVSNVISIAFALSGSFTTTNGIYYSILNKGTKLYN